MRQDITDDDIKCALRVIRNAAALVEDRRYREGISLREGERQTGVSFATIQRFETRSGRAHVDTLTALLEWLAK